MKAHICHVFPSFVSGGSQVRTCRLMNAMGAAYRHSVIGLDQQNSAGELIHSSVDWKSVKAPKKAGSWATIRALKARFEGLSPDLVCTYNWGAIDALIAASWAGVRATLHHEDGFGADEAIRPKLRRTWMRRLVLPRANGVLVPSRTLLGIATGRWHLAPEQVHHIPIGIRIEDFPPADGNSQLRAQWKIPQESWVIGSVGHLRPEKNPLRLLRAFALIPSRFKAHLLLLGEGPERGKLETCIQELGLAERVSMVGYQSAPAPFYRSMDCLAISSDTEQMPVNLLEAMAATLPVVSTEVGDVRHMLPREQSGWVLPIDRSSESATAAALGRALTELLEQPDLARAMGQANHGHLVETYSFQGMLQSFQGHYEKAIGRGKA